MWTLNSSRYLNEVLARIRKVIPCGAIEKIVVVDGGSVDKTVEVARAHGCEVHITHAGIPHQANLALNHVDTEFFVTVEHDVLLANNWWRKISKYMKDSRVAVAQGIRIPSHPVLAKFDSFVYSIQQRKVCDYGISIDNNIYRTSIIRSIGGFPSFCPIAVDRELREKVEKEGYRWIIDPLVVSEHIRDSLWRTIKHDYYILKNIKRSDQLLDLDKCALNKVRIVVSLPITAIRMVLKMREPRLFPYLFIHRLVRIIAMIKRSQEIKKERETIKNFDALNNPHDVAKSFIQSKKILDVGCGVAGYWRKNRNVVGCDVWKPSLLKAKTNCQVILCDVRKLPIRPKTFDTVAMIETIEHLTKDDGYALLQEVEKIAKKEVVLTTPLKFVEGIKNGNPYQSHQSVWSNDELTACGFEIKKEMDYANTKAICARKTVAK